MDQELAKLVVKLALDASQYAKELAQSAKQTADWASNVTRHASQGAGAFGNAIGPVGKLTGALGSMAVVAGGIIAANIFGQIAGGLSSFVSTGIQAVATAQTLQMGMEALLTANNMYERSVEQVTTATTKELMTEAEFAQKQAELAAKITTQQATYQEQEERIRQLTAQYGDNGLVVIKTKAQHEQLALAIRATEQDLAGLTRTSTDYGTTTETVYNQTMNMADAQRLAAKQSKELLGFVEELAVVSPFEQEQVAMVAKYAIAAGLATDDAKGFTTGFLDLSAAVGISSESLAFAADQLLQVSKVGKLTEIDLRQLRRLGIDLEKIIGVEMGMSIEEFNKKAGESPEIFNELFNSVAKFSKNTFGGTVERMASSVDGMKSTLKDLFTVGSRKFFQPIIEAVTPAAQDIIGKMTSFILGGGGMDKLGQRAAELFTGGLSKLGAISRAFGRSFDEGFRMIGFFVAKAWPGIEAQLATWGNNFWNWLNNVAMPAGQAALANFTTWLGGQVAAYWPIVEAQLATWGNQFWNWVLALYPQIPGLLSGLTQSIAASLVANWPAISASLMEWTVKFWDWARNAAAGVGAGMAALGAALMTWATSPEAQTAMTLLGQSLGTMLTDAIKLSFEGGEGATNVIVSLTNGLLMATGAILGTLIIVGGQIVAGITSGILASMGIDLQPATFSQLSGILTGIGANIKTIASVVGKNIVTAIKTGWTNTVQTVTDAFTAGVESWTKIITETEWAEIGENIIKGILKGINDNVTKVFEVIKSMAETVISEALAAWGIHSPSTVFADMGNQLVQGLVQGVTAGIPNFQAAYDKLFGVTNRGGDIHGIIGEARDDLEKFLDMKGIEGSKADLALRNLNALFHQNADEILSATDQAAAFEAIIKRQARNGISFGFLTEGGGIDILSDAVGEFVKAFDQRKKEMEAALQAAIIMASRKAVELAGKLNDFAMSAAGRVTQQVDSLYAMLQTNATQFDWEGQIISATEAQQLYNDALAEQLASQQQIAQLQKNQSDLAFLQQQLDLMEQARAAGLNMADIFGGLEFGLNASLPDLIAATNAVVQAMIDQVNSDLEIASPSKVMGRIGQRIMEGLAEGISGAASLPVGAMGGASQQIINKTFNQTNYISGGGGLNTIGEFQQGRALFST